MNPPASFSKPTWKTADIFDLALAEDPEEVQVTGGGDPTWREQMAHAQMLLSWRKVQGLAEEDSPRNPEPFEMTDSLV